jgi:hypothetical protein
MICVFFVVGNISWLFPMPMLMGGILTITIRLMRSFI